MAFRSSQVQGSGGWDVIAALADADGCAGHAHLHRLATQPVALRDLADAIHALCAVHGRTTSLFAEAAQRGAAANDSWQAPDWVSGATEAFAHERGYLAALTAAAGPLPSTPGQAETDAAFAGQRHAFDMLARSDRAGCATGAAVALIIDWHAFRSLLDRGADRFAIAVAPTGLPDAIEVATIVTALGDSPGLQRAMAFGAQQVFAQHRGLFDLLDARAAARDR